MSEVMQEKPINGDEFQQIDALLSGQAENAVIEDDQPDTGEPEEQGAISEKPEDQQQENEQQEADARRILKTLW